MKYELIQADLLGNDIDGYDWNDNRSIGYYELDESIFNGSDNEVIAALIKAGIFSEHVANFSFEIDCQECTENRLHYYIDLYNEAEAPRSKESFELRPIF